MGLRLIVLAVFVIMSFSLRADDNVLTWTGCGISKKAYVINLAKAFETKEKVEVKITGGGATKGIRKTAMGETDVGGSCRLYLRQTAGDVHPEESNVEFIQVAWDALVPIVNLENPVSSIALDDLKKIYLGEITNWSQVASHSQAPIELVVRNGKYSGVGHMFRKLVFNDPELEFKHYAFAEKSTGPLEKRVGKVANALAMDGISSAKKSFLKTIAVDGVLPTKENIGSGKYPLFRPLYLTLPKNSESKMARAFVEFALSEEGQQIISKNGTVNLSEGAVLNALWQTKMDGSVVTQH